MKLLVVLVVLFIVTAQGKSVSKLADLQFIHTAEERDAIESTAEVNIAEETTGRELILQSENAGKVYAEPHDRIINGVAATKGQIPWQALLFADGVGFSGGSLISPGWVLTAAHCLYGYKSFLILLGSTTRAGESGSVTQNARQAIIHANYNKDTVENDIGVLKLTTEVTLTNYINVVRLPRQSQASTTFAGEAAMVSGFGRINPENSDVSDVLLYVNVDIITNAQCAQQYGSIVKETNICSLGANGTNVCTGDSGGPLVVREPDGKYTEVGIVSFGGSCSAGEAAAYTRVSKYLSWISNTTAIAIQA